MRERNWLHYLLFSIILVVSCAYSLQAQLSRFTNAVNGVLGDVSYVEKFHEQPSSVTNENVRVGTHLEYVERMLRERTTQHLSIKQKQNRKKILALLHQYRKRGIYPVNEKYPNDRRPCFIDEHNNICAVGYLIEKTTSRDLAQDINSRHQYDAIMEMNEPLIETWAKTNGLTLEECAMIQPQYGAAVLPVVTEAEISRGYGVSSGISSGVNLALSLLNIKGNKSRNNILPIAGLITGSGQIILGAVSIKKSYVYEMPGIPSQRMFATYKAQNNLSYINIAMGTTTIISSAYNLLINKNHEKKSQVSLFSYPGVNNSLTMGLTVTKRI